MQLPYNDSRKDQSFSAFFTFILDRYDDLKKVGKGMFALLRRTRSMGSNFSPRKANAQILLTQIETIRSDYLSAKRSQRELQNQKEMLEAEIADKKRELEVLQTAADT